MGMPLMMILVNWSRWWYWSINHDDNHDGDLGHDNDDVGRDDDHDDDVGHDNDDVGNDDNVGDKFAP